VSEEQIKKQIKKEIQIKPDMTFQPKILQSSKVLSKKADEEGP